MVSGGRDKRRHASVGSAGGDRKLDARCRTQRSSLEHEQLALCARQEEPRNRVQPGDPGYQWLLRCLVHGRPRLRLCHRSWLTESERTDIRTRRAVTSTVKGLSPSPAGRPHLFCWDPAKSHLACSSPSSNLT